MFNICPNTEFDTLYQIEPRGKYVKFCKRKMYQNLNQFRKNLKRVHGDWMPDVPNYNFLEYFSMLRSHLNVVSNHIFEKGPKRPLS